ncbi:hypothetical protein LSAT2_002056 [Lamellibrachia satsuma]|nr:hypothetical protein LSAT2_002056 [Lamellibrachia satsuma]
MQPRIVIINWVLLRGKSSAASRPPGRRGHKRDQTTASGTTRSGGDKEHRQSVQTLAAPVVPQVSPSQLVVT